MTAARRGATVSGVMTVAYAGFTAGPAFVGLAADRLGLRAALCSVAVFAFLLVAAVGFMPRADATAGRPDRDGRAATGSGSP